ncbi:family 2 encapsulin nanocompartment cargo protein polyprenyl transferase [Actinokineospora sp. NPDC004072]
MTEVDVSTPRRSASEVLEWSRAAVDPALRAAVDRLPDSMRVIAGYHFGWWDEHGLPTGADAGKALRPTLALLAARAVGGTAEAALPAAVAVQLVHDFSLLHDDVMDGDTVRRHRPTAWRVFGVNQAILAGDALLTLAMEVLADSGHPAAQRAVKLLGEAVQRLTAGQSADVSFETREKVDLAECLRMVEGKTGALFGASCALGALFGGGSSQQVLHLRWFGEKLGLAFQFVDDVLGVWGDSAITGKPIHSDLDSRKKSLPVVAALTSGTPTARALRLLYHADAPLDLTHAADLIERCGAREWSHSQAEALLTQARVQLRAASPVDPAAQELETIARLATHRDH